MNDPNQVQQLQKLEEKNNLLEKRIEKLAAQLNTKFDDYEAILEKVNTLEKNIQELQKSLPRAISSDDCFEILKEKDVEMCIVNTDTRVTTLEPPFLVIKSNDCIEGDILDICIEKFEIKGIVTCELNADF